MRIGYVILAHNDPKGLLRLVKRILTHEDHVAIHWDAKNSFDIKAFFHAHVDNDSLDRIAFAERHSVTWGGWSMIEATLSAIKELISQDVDYVYLLSGSDYPIKPVSVLKRFLARNSGKEFLEHSDPTIDTWVIRGLTHERYKYYHFFNWRYSPKVFGQCLTLQKLLKVNRRPPNKFKPYFGSQWWCLTKDTVAKVYQAAFDKKVQRYFRWTWVPDELFFQTMVCNLVPMEQLHNGSLTLYKFNELGVPYIFYNDHFDVLQNTNSFFARKVSPYANELKDKLDELQDSDRCNIELDDIIPSRSIMLPKISQPNPQNKSWLSHNEIDDWQGHLATNRNPYFTIYCSSSKAAIPLLRAINRAQGFIGLGDVFNQRRICYGYSHNALPGYKSSDVELRDHKRPNFAYDIIQYHNDNFVGWSISFPCHTEMGDVTLFDQNCIAVFIMPDFIADLLNFRIRRDNNTLVRDVYIFEAEPQSNFEEVGMLNRKWSSKRNELFLYWHLTKYLRETHKDFLICKESQLKDENFCTTLINELKKMLTVLRAKNTLCN